MKNLFFRFSTMKKLENLVILILKIKNLNSLEKKILREAVKFFMNVVFKSYMSI